MVVTLQLTTIAYRGCRYSATFSLRCPVQNQRMQMLKLEIGRQVCTLVRHLMLRVRHAPAHPAEAKVGFGSEDHVKC